MQSAKPKKSYKNPVYLALKWQKMLDSGECESRAELSRKLGVSRARVTQILQLLELDKVKLKEITNLGDPLPSKIRITERHLRKIIKRKSK